MPRTSPSSSTADHLPASLSSGHMHLFGKAGPDSFTVEQFKVSTDKPVRWDRPPAPECVEIWINLNGAMSVQVDDVASQQRIEPNAFFLCLPGNQASTMFIEAKQRQKFYLMRLGLEFISAILPKSSGNLHCIARSLVDQALPESFLGSLRPMTPAMREFASTLDSPPVVAAARALWYRAKVQELVADVMFESTEKELFCTRQKRITSERIAQVKRLLRSRLSDPPNLQEIARQVGCSPYYLSRTFSKETGMTIPQFLREIRIDRAAELLRTGECNVTEAAFEVGYNSPSHFSHAFCQKMGVCPAMYPRSAKEKTAS